MRASAARALGQIGPAAGPAVNDLARALVKRKLETQQLQRRLETRRRELNTGLEQLGQRLDENRSRLEDLQQQAELLSEPDPEQASAASWAQADTGVRAAEVEVAFLREKQRRTQS